MHQPEHSLLLPFDSDDPEFVRGFEAGRVWALVSAAPDEEVEVTVHAKNTEMLMRIGEALARPVVGEVVDDTWSWVRFAPAGETPESYPDPGIST